MSAAPQPPAPRRRGSLRRKILLVVMTATLAALLLSAAALLLYEVRSYRSGVVSDLRSQADLIGQAVASALVLEDRRSARQTLSALALRPQIQQAAIFDARGRRFADYRAADAATDAELAGPASPATRFNGDELELSQEIQRDGERVGILVLRTQHQLLGRVVDYLWILALTTTAGLGLAALIFRQLHPAITSPILEMAEVARRVMEHRNYGLRVNARSDDEVGTLVDAFNNMLQELSMEMRERHTAEVALRAADRRKDEFLATLAHELRNPLAPMANALAVLKRADDKPEVRSSTRAMMERQLAHMVRLIDDLMDVSRITRGKLELRRQPIDVVLVVRTALEAAEPLLRQHGHAVTCELPPQAVQVSGDAARLTQVFVNLLHNAARYTPRGGNVRLAVRPQPGHVEVLVADDGIGIDPAQQALIFEMFAQVDTSLERGAAGLGVGLTIARQIVEMHDGAIRVDSPGTGGGSVFAVTLPVAEAAPAEPLAAPPASGNQRPTAARVLIADDNVDFSNSFGNLLRIEGHVVRVVHDGQAALAAAAEEPPDVAFLDIGMPGLNGYELASRLRAGSAARVPLLVAVTGWGQEADRRRARDAGFHQHLVKPIQIEQALALLRMPGPEPGSRG